MSSLSSAKAVGGVGAILVLLSLVPQIGALFGIAGFIMILIAIKSISDTVEDPKIFKNMMTAVILSIIGIVIASVVVMATLLTAFQNGYFTSSYPFTPSTAVTTAQWIAFGLAIGLGLFIAWILLLVSAIYLRRSYDLIGSALDVSAFKTAGLVYLIGAATAIVGVGFVIIIIGEIIGAVAFFSIPNQRPEKQKLTPAAAPPS